MTSPLEMNFDVLFASLRIWSCALAVFLLLTELTSTLVFSLFLFSTAALYVLLIFYRIPRPGSEIDNEIMGEDISLTKEPLEDVWTGLAEGKKTVVKSVAHRFAALDAPENTMAALKNVFEHGVSMVEFDLALTKDKVPILFHDWTVDRMTNAEGYVSTFNYEELAKLDLSVKHPVGHKFRGAKIAKFAEVVEFCLSHDIRMIIDVKDHQSETITAITEMFDKHPRMYRRAVVTSFNPFIIYNIRKSRPAIIGCMSWRPFYMSHNGLENLVPVMPYSNSPFGYFKSRVMNKIHDFCFDNIYYHILGLSAVLLNKDCVHPEVVKKWKQRGVRVMAWTVNDRWEKIHFSRNVRITYLSDSLTSE